ncbi:AAA family ATPase [Lacrimispora celerecrescens]|uniref:PD-(D/E)XK nuclease superfamily protein n=1 Tax=[Clostridium] celerecrescens 18A TaxID=1286362 RepID=A0A2M8Z6W3_9FIRM|nr:AAA family ATPase [Lacrimispora celerecrescens]PJJ29192.1 PD-(D/E)XK nuclease superfamily protein [[Clostridium] celerecrescens 18A]
MGVKRILPIGNDDFRKLRENGSYYVDKTLMIKDFIEMKDEVALIARPRRFGKTLNMTMLKEFFDIETESRDIFDGLAIMDTEYADQINSRPVIYFTFKNSKGTSVEELTAQLKLAMQEQYGYYEEKFRDKLNKNSFSAKKFYESYDLLMDQKSTHIYLSSVLLDLTRVVYDFYHIRPILLIDEYDQPIMSSYEYGYHDQLGPFFANLYGSAMKGNSALGQALITGVQRVAKESIFSQFNNARVYTVMHKQYASYFGLTAPETEKLLTDYDLVLDENVQIKYYGYRFGGIEIYNPWSVLNYADIGSLDNYWINTSSNFLVKQALRTADKRFWDDFDKLASGKEISVWLTLETSYIERDSNYSLWGLLVNSGYLTALKRIDSNTAVVKIPNDEVMSEFQVLIAEISGVDGLDLQQMLSCLINKDMKRFFELYQDIVISCTSYMDAKENAYHMLFLGMCIALRGAYKVTSNIEAGYGRSDITLEALMNARSHVIIEFKQGEDLERLKEEALEQIIENQYYTGLKGEVICIGLAHDKKRCSMVHKTLQI